MARYMLTQTPDKLKFRRKTKEFTVYNLVVGKSGSSLCFAHLGQTSDSPTVTDSTPTDAPQPLWLCPQLGNFQCA